MVATARRSRATCPVRVIHALARPHPGGNRKNQRVICTAASSEFAQRAEDTQRHLLARICRNLRQFMLQGCIVEPLRQTGSLGGGGDMCENSRHRLGPIDASKARAAKCKFIDVLVFRSIQDVALITILFETGGMKSGKRLMRLRPFRTWLRIAQTSSGAIWQDQEEWQIWTIQIRVLIYWACQLPMS